MKAINAMNKNLKFFWGGAAFAVSARHPAPAQMANASPGNNWNFL
jgi:hypothetical protein